MNPKNEEKDDKPLAARLGEHLDQATAQIEGDAIGDPLTVARMQRTLGLSQLGMGFPEKAIPLFKKALSTAMAEPGPDHGHVHLDTLFVQSSLAQAYEATGQLELALPLAEEALPLLKSLVDPDHHETRISRGCLAGIYFDQGKLDRAIPLLEENLALDEGEVGSSPPRYARKHAQPRDGL